MLRAGDVFDRYVIDDVLGEGGMGTVYRALDTRLSRRVALKVVRMADAASADARARLVREARAAASLTHPNVIGVYDVGEYDGTPFIAMELVRGRSLRTYIGDDSVPLAKRIEWLVDVARALDAAHRAGLVHRDVKPDNVVVNDEDGTVKVLDFGIARAMREVDPVGRTAAPGAWATITAEGVAIGTPLYMPPEQIRGDEVDAKADQFSWGVMAYELLGGATPWPNARDVLSLAAAIVSDPAPPLRSLAPEVPAYVEAVVMRALQKASAARWPTMRAIVDELRPGGTGKVEVVPRAPVGEKRSALVPAGIALLLLAFGALGVRAVLSGPATSTAPTVASSPSSASAASAANAANAANAKDWVRIIDHPAPASTRPEAVAAFASGLAAARDANWEGARQRFESALELDPAMAEAAAYTALYRAFGGATKAQVRDLFDRALTVREKLGERDRQFLLALEPQMRDPADLAESGRRFVALADAYPRDAEIHCFAGNIALLLGDDAGALRLQDRAVELDPAYADALQSRARMLMRAGRPAEAIAALEHCNEVSPSSPDCNSDRAAIAESMGDCVAAEAAARRGLARSPRNTLLLDQRAAALVSLGRSKDAIDEALRAKWNAHDEGLRANLRALDEASLAATGGAFQTALRLALAAERAPTTDKSAGHHGLPLRLAFELETELGNDANALKHATSYLSRRDAWVPMTPLRDPVPMLLFAQRKGGLLSPAQHEEQRNAWLSRGRSDPFVEWVVAYAPEALASREQAAAALDRMPPGDVWKIHPHYQLGFDLASIQLGAGRFAEAIPLLRAYASSCNALRDPVRVVRASLLLGQALEATNDVPGACAAYRVVVEKWKDAPRSVTLDQAKARETALACAKR